jgi:hypothetical protein
MVIQSECVLISAFQENNSLPAALYDCKIQSLTYKYLKAQFWGKYLDFRYYIMGNFVICTLQVYWYCKDSDKKIK